MTMRYLPGTRGRKRLYLMRHGEVSYHRPDGRTVFSNQVDLTEEGVAQAEAMAATLKEVEFDLAAHTGVLRTRRTAEIVLAGREIAARTLPELIEIQGGSIEGMTDERLEAEFVYGLERAAMPGANFAGGETFAAFQARIVGAMCVFHATVTVDFSGVTGHFKNIVTGDFRNSVTGFVKIF